MRELQYRSLNAMELVNKLNIMKLLQFVLATILAFLCFAEYAFAAPFPLLEDTNDFSETEQSLSIAVLTQEPRRRGFISFAVRADGAFAVAQENNTDEREKLVAVYDAGGVFMYAVCFRAPGAYGVDFDGDALRLWLVRGNCAVTVDEHGYVIRVQCAQDANAFAAYWAEELSASEHTTGGAVYRGEDAGWFAQTFAHDHGRLTLTQNGNAQVLYQAEQRPLFPAYGSFIVIMILLTAVMTLVVLVLHKRRKKRIAC